jgi:phosphoribosylformylglycinamidine cyclo-ligase
VVLRRGQWPRAAVFDWLARTGNISDAEMHRTFNCGIGMVVIVPATAVAAALALLAAQGETAWHIGDVRHGNRGVVIEA